MNAATETKNFADFKVADLALADWGRKEIAIAQTETGFYFVPGLAGDLHQDLGAVSLVVEIIGSLHGDSARDDFLTAVREKFAAGSPELTEALARLGKTVVSSSFDTAYNSGRSTQVPTGRTLAVRDRVRRRIGYDGNYVVLERA